VVVPDVELVMQRSGAHHSNEVGSKERSQKQLRAAASVEKCLFVLPQLSLDLRFQNPDATVALQKSILKALDKFPENYFACKQLT
jgi:hypothetical protein